ncbi:MAG: hypothetical protein SD837_07285 [Candidatus Electrothrix scaldis]|nr:MAG: hypothetical protein SD837_07285 [Candidatus Electrothrix sp. GW3-3]
MWGTARSSAGAARKVAEILKAHNHLLEPKISRGAKKDSVLGMNGKMSREWWEVHPESSGNILDEG